MFTCRAILPSGARWRLVPVEVLEHREGTVAIQSEIGDDALTAVVVSSPRTYYRFHTPVCQGAFSATQLRKVRP